MEDKRNEDDMKEDSVAADFIAEPLHHVITLKFFSNMSLHLVSLHRMGGVVK